MAVASTTLAQRGTVHLLASASDAGSSVTLADGATTAVLIEDDGKATALDTQRDSLIKESAEQDAIALARARQPSTICPSTMIAGTSRGWRSSRVATFISAGIR